MSKPLHLGFNAIKKPVNLTSDRKTHHHVIGSSGSGKSKFLEQMIRGDLEARQGLCLIDPHGTLYNAVVKYCARWTLRNDIVLLNPSNPTHINGFNFFSKTHGGDTSVQVENRITATLHAWDAKNADQTPTLERILRCVYTMLLDADLTLPEVAKLLDHREKGLRTSLIEKVRNEAVRREWEDLNDIDKPADFRNEVLSAKNRLFRLVSSDGLMRFLAVKETIDLTDAMNRQRTILVNLAPSKYLSRGQARVFGSLLVSQFFECAMDRKPAGLGQDPAPYYLYIDELANFVSIDLANALDELRKFGLFCILSHQRFGQIDEDFIDAILTNCRIKTVFGGLPEPSAQMMAKELFLGKLDPMRIKLAIYQTKHLYQYGRDKVYSHSETYGESSGTATTVSKGSGTGTGIASGMVSSETAGQTTLPPSEDLLTAAVWFGDPVIKSESHSESKSFSDVQSQSHFETEAHSDTESYSTSYSETVGEADVPIWIPVPFKELTGVQYWSIEEQMLELTQALKLQMQRHCFIQLPGQQTQPLLVPWVKDHPVTELNTKRYVELVAKRTNALSVAEADKMIEEAALSRPRLNKKPSKARRKKEKKSIFDKIKESNPKLDI